MNDNWNVCTLPGVTIFEGWNERIAKGVELKELQQLAGNYSVIM